MYIFKIKGWNTIGTYLTHVNINTIRVNEQHLVVTPVVDMNHGQVKSSMTLCYKTGINLSKNGPEKTHPNRQNENITFSKFKMIFHKFKQMSLY